MEKKADPDRVYHRDTVAATAIDDGFKHPFIHFLQKDYEGRTFGFSERILAAYCIDMDEVETASPCAQNDATMDLAVGIGRFNDTERSFSRKRLLPVELKLDCESFRSLAKDRRKLENKDVHTRDLLQAHGVDSRSVFLFTKSVAPEALRYVSQWKREPGSVCGRWKVLDPGQYDGFICFEEDFEYKPVISEKEIREAVECAVSKGGIEGLIVYLEWLKKKAEWFSMRYNRLEVAHISSVVGRIAEEGFAHATQDEDSVDYLGLLFADFRQLGVMALDGR